MTNDPLDGWDDELNDWTDTARCDTGGCIAVTYEADRVHITETDRPDQTVTTSRGNWDTFINGIRDQERARFRAAIVAGLRARARFVDRVATPTGPYRSHIFQTLADVIERGEFDDLVAGDE